jgi:hypothetical protein
MYINGGENVTVRNSRFTQCTLFDIFATLSGPEAAKIGHRNLVLENNFFDTPWTEDKNTGGSPTRGSTVALAWCTNSDKGYRDVFIRHNTFGSGLWGKDPSQVCVMENIRVEGNLLQYQGTCDDKFTYAYNAWNTSYRTGKCSTTDVIAGASFPFVNPTPGPGFDFHLATASSLDELIPNSFGCPATDIDGKPRPTGSGCTPGAHER